MTTYESSGVSIERGDKASELAYAAAKSTFKSRENTIGRPMKNLHASFTGAIDCGAFYLTQNEDGVGSKAVVAEAIGKYDTLGADLVAMVADDAVCAGAEVISLGNTIDTEKVEPKKINALMKGLAKVCRQQKIIIPGGEIAELPAQVRGFTWNATAVGIVEKKKILTGKKVRKGDVLLALLEHGFRSNGFTLVRYILQKTYGKNWVRKPFQKGKTWGSAVLIPSTVYHGCVLEMIGRYKEKPRVSIHGIAHITGGGLPGNLPRVLEANRLVADIMSLPDPPEVVRRVQKLGCVSDMEAYKTWCMGIGMVLVLPKKEVEKAQSIAKKHKIGTHVIGIVTSSGL